MLIIPDGYYGSIGESENLDKLLTWIDKGGKVIAFENAEKLNPPVEKRKKPIITSDLKEKSLQIKKEIQIREIPEIQANIEFIDDDKSD